MYYISKAAIKHLNAIERLIERYMEEHNDTISKEAMDPEVCWQVETWLSPSPDEVTSNTVISCFFTWSALCATSFGTYKI